MKKLILSAAVAAALAGSAFAYNAIAAAPDAADAPQGRQMADRGFLLDARLAGMKAALKLTPDQEKLWPAFETAVRDAAKARQEAMQARREGGEGGQRPSPIAMMTRMSERLAKASDELKKVADAATPLYNSLDDTQKSHFGPLLRMMRPQRPHPGGWGRERGRMEPNPL